ncbi:MAG: AEC family transporter [Bacteroidaceae bacterium]|nr:AEC family transporter [Bacteroidaceae bacterium]
MGNIDIMITLFAIVIVGYMAGKLDYMDKKFDRKLSSLVVDITCPALILSSTMGGELPDRELILPLLGISFITYILLTAVAVWLPRLLTRHKEQEGVVGFALMFGNVGFIGYPIVASIFGAQAVFYAAMLNVVNTFFVFTVGAMLVNGVFSDVQGQTAKTSKRKQLFNKKIIFGSPMVAAYLAMLIVALRIDHIPTVICAPLTMIGNITVPAALLIVGSSMSKLSAKMMLGNRAVYAITVFRLLIIPVSLYYLFMAVGFAPLVVNINTVIIAMPVATYGTILCLKYGRDTTLMTEATFITTLLSVLTIPLLSMVF